MSTFLRTDVPNAQGADPGALTVTATGQWVSVNVAAIDLALGAVTDFPKSAPVVLNLSQLESVDSAGAWLLHRLRDRLSQSGRDLHVSALPSQWQSLYDRVGALSASRDVAPDYRPRVEGYVERLGRNTVNHIETIGAFMAFLGEWFVSLWRAIIDPRRFRVTSIFYHLEHVGFDALPIVGLISFLIGVVLAYQGTIQLRLFGAEIYTIDLIALAVLRELGILLTAIVVAGRTASAYTAQLGSMRVNEEVDALKTLGLDPIELLVRPRVIALTIAMPILTLFANFTGLLGGGVMSYLVLDVEPVVYLNRLRDAADVASFWVGMVKAPVFGLVIALVGCFEGMRVSGSAENVGKHTTQSVVEAIFLVIVLDALFSIVFGILGV